MSVLRYNPNSGEWYPAPQSAGVVGHEYNRNNKTAHADRADESRGCRGHESQSRNPRNLSTDWLEEQARKRQLELDEKHRHHPSVHPADTMSHLSVSRPSVYHPIKRQSTGSGESTRENPGQSALQRTKSMARGVLKRNK